MTPRVCGTHDYTACGQECGTHNYTACGQECGTHNYTACGQECGTHNYTACGRECGTHNYTACGQECGTHNYTACGQECGTHNYTACGQECGTHNYTACGQECGTHGYTACVPSGYSGLCVVTERTEEEEGGVGRTLIRSGARQKRVPLQSQEPDPQPDQGPVRSAWPEGQCRISYLETAGWGWGGRREGG